MVLLDSELIEYKILELLQRSEDPMGALSLREALLMDNLRVSQATVGRILYQLELADLVYKAQGRQGRLLTAKGRAKLSAHKQGEKRADYLKQVFDALEIENLEDVIASLQVRKLLEPTAVKYASRYADEQARERMRDTITAMEQAIESNKDSSIPSRQFHIIIAESSKNKILSTLIKILINEQGSFDTLDALGWAKETRSVIDHVNIFNAIEQRADARAERYMLQHLERIENVVQEEIMIRKKNSK